MMEYNKNRKSRGFIPDSLFDTGIDFEGFADDLMKQMGFADSEKPSKPSYHGRSYSYEDTGIIDESIHRTLAMFPDSYENIASPLILGTRPTEALPQYGGAEPHAYADSYEQDGMDLHLSGTIAENSPYTFTYSPWGQSASSTDVDSHEEGEPIDAGKDRALSMPMQMDFDEAPEQPPKKKRFKFFAPTRGGHIRLILIVLAILMLDMLVLGFLASRGILNIGF